MDEKIKKILDDITSLDSSMRQHEPELKKIIKLLIESKPDTKFDDEFRNSLRNKLDKYLSSQDNKKVKSSWFNSTKFIYAFNGAALMALLMIGGYAFFNKIVYNNPEVKNTLNETADYFANKGKDSELSFASNIKKVEPNAFDEFLSGSMQDLDNVNLMGAIVEKDIQDKRVYLKPNAKNSDLTLPIEATTVDEFSNSGSNNSAVIEPMPINDLSLIRPPAFDNQYRYEYVGEPINLDQVNLPVYTLVKDVMTNENIKEFVENIDIDLVDLYVVSSPLLGSFEIISNIVFGHIFKFDFVNKEILVSPYSTKWPKENFSDPNWWEKNKLNISDIPSDDNLIKIADSFLEKYRFDKANYESPYVNNEWREYLNDENIENYIPNNINVIYPQMINGYKVINYYGDENGLMVNINIRHKKVESVNNFSFNSYLASDYELESNSDIILSHALKGGKFVDYNINNKSENVVELGTPSIVYVKINYKEFNSENGLLIPCYSFPVDKTNDELNRYRKQVIVPLIKKYYQ